MADVALHFGILDYSVPLGACVFVCVMSVDDVQPCDNNSHLLSFVLS